jgi:lipopolysaccharide/colanic/teichoic acid biosynthesis glycosyltransferase
MRKENLSNLKFERKVELRITRNKEENDRDVPRHMRKKDKIQNNRKGKEINRLKEIERRIFPIAFSLTTQFTFCCISNLITIFILSQSLL